MIQTVLKRDGRVVGFNEEKIATAIRKAMLHTDKGGRPATDTPDYGPHLFQGRFADDGGSHPGFGGSGADEEQPQGRCPEIHRLPQPAKHCPQSKDARHVPGNHQHQVQRHHTRKCQHECRYPGGHDDEVCQRNHQAFCGRLSAE